MLSIADVHSEEVARVRNTCVNLGTVNSVVVASSSPGSVIKVDDIVVHFPLEQEPLVNATAGAEVINSPLWTLQSIEIIVIVVVIRIAFATTTAISGTHSIA